MDFALSAAAEDRLGKLREFLRQKVLPLEPERLAEIAPGRQSGDWRSWTTSPAIESLKREARAAGLWNLFLPDAELGAGITTLEYAPLAEEMGRSPIAPEIFNCNAPDTGNMEVLAKYGSAEQRARWLRPLLDGEIRSAFCMTEPGVASSDPLNLAATARVEGDEVVLDGSKWWSTGLGHPRCALLVFFGLTHPEAERHRRHSMVLVPVDSPGVTIRRMLPLLGDFDPPYGHGEVNFANVRVPRANLVAGPGRGFEIAQGRLGPGRIHHCMRALGAAERALEMMIDRARSRSAFGELLVDLGGNRERIADLRLAIDQARLLTLRAAWRLDREGSLAARVDVSAIKVVAPAVLERAVDAAIQMHGAEGLSCDLPLTAFLAQARALRIADGPDEVHRAVVARAELARGERGAAPVRA